MQWNSVSLWLGSARMLSAASEIRIASVSRLTSSPPCLTTVVLSIPHQLQLSSSLRFTLAPCSSSRQRTAQVTQLLTDLSPALYVLLIADNAVGLCPLRLYVRRCNTTPSPWWLLCLQWSLLSRPLARPEPLSGLIAHTLSCLCLCLCLCHASCHALCRWASIRAPTPRRRRSSAERCYEKKEIEIYRLRGTTQRRTVGLRIECGCDSDQDTLIRRLASHQCTTTISPTVVFHNSGGRMHPRCDLKSLVCH